MGGGGGMATPQQRWEKGGGRVGGNKERKRWRLLSRVYLPVALVAVWQKRLFVSPLICRVSQRVDVFIMLRFIVWERRADGVRAPCLEVQLTSA